ncbi:uncharacterized protein EI97DRAFT_447782 [Westerdykella ornata]|uniref:Endoplasmic reticulum junction formation protein lunapark n=1 Tax=Westerdykella ornata TaxID=318751 RepID=A0A6A6JUC5_WESOR|nr:uncharacterized protein EI97DRAFT_447782 [Westerdykella ornata]KAF2280220.1 hypothetical protein EI97DRAFT_447782 [Westerdykella ornata]
MVSFWPWRTREDAASFEKTLSALSAKISKAASQNDARRQRSRRVRVMWTLYAGFAYILAALLLIFVSGWRSWGAIEISVIAGGPLVIYLVRTSLTTFYEYRISNTQAYLERLNKEREDAIERLKAATKYNTTQQLLEKYGSSPKPKQSTSPSSAKKAEGPHKPALPQGPRTGIAPPPTANIRRPIEQRPPTLQNQPQPPASPQAQSPAHPLPPVEAPGAEYAPNAFDAADLTRQYSSSAPKTFTQSHWYDRILDALLGEDETQPKNRLALICSECRLVNGQAPPGTRTLEDVGRWRCGGCHAWNGKEKVDEIMVADLVQSWESERRAKEKDAGGNTDGGNDSDNRESGDDAGAIAGESQDSDDDIAEAPTPTSQPSKPTKARGKSKGKK